MSNTKGLAPDFIGHDIINNVKYQLSLHKGKVILLGFVHTT